MELLLMVIYLAVAGASIFGLLVAAAKFTGSNMEFPIGWVLCGIFWPVALLPAMGYLAAGWYLNRKNMNNE